MENTSPEPVSDQDSAGIQKQFLAKGFLWQILHERDGWASSTKLTRIIAFFVATFLLLWTVIKGVIPGGLAELTGIYLAYAIGARYFSQVAWKKENENVGDPR